MISYTVSWEELEGRYTKVNIRLFDAYTACEAIELFLKEVEDPNSIISISAEETELLNKRMEQIRSISH